MSSNINQSLVLHRMIDNTHSVYRRSQHQIISRHDGLVVVLSHFAEHHCVVAFKTVYKMYAASTNLKAGWPGRSSRSLTRRCEVELKFTVHYSLFGPNSDL